MTVAAVAFAPHPPLLVPAVGAGPTPALDALRAACLDVVATALATGVEQVVTVGADAVTREYAGGAGSFAPFGVDVSFQLGRPVAAPPRLPLSLAVGAWLLDAAGWQGDAAGVGVASGGEPEAARLVAALASGRRTALLVLADGTHCRSVAAPGSYDARAAEADAGVARWLASGGAESGSLDQAAALAGELGMAGVPAWRVAAAVTAGAGWRAALAYDDAPFGVGYLAAVWTRA